MQTMMRPVAAGRGLLSLCYHRRWMDFPPSFPPPSFPPLSSPSYPPTPVYDQLYLDRLVSWRVLGLLQIAHHCLLWSCLWLAQPFLHLDWYVSWQVLELLQISHRLLLLLARPLLRH